MRGFIKYIKHIHISHQVIDNEVFFSKLRLSKNFFNFQKKIRRIVTKKDKRKYIKASQPWTKMFVFFLAAR